MPDQTGPGVVVRPARPSDLPSVAAGHTHHLPHGLFPTLGERFMRRWHATFLDAPHGVSLVAELGGTADPVPVGFLVGSTDQVRHVTDVIRRHRLGLGATGVAALLLRPAVAAHFLRTRAGAYLRRVLSPRATEAAAAPGSPGGHGAPARAPQIAVVTAVVVDPAARHAGVGAALVRRFVDLAEQAGAPQAQLTTLAGDDGAGAFYRSLGWRHVGDGTTRDGAVMSTYRLDLPGRPSASEDRAGSAARDGR